jgi:hypothetical protein
MMAKSVWGAGLSKRLIEHTAKLSSTKEKTMSDQKDIHRKLAIDCFNGTWDLIEKTDRTPEENASMIHMAHASRFHWGQIGIPLNLARGDWQISRVYAILGQGKNSLNYAKSSLHICKDYGIGDFDLAFAYEAAARAFATLGDAEMKEQHLALAQEAGETIVKDEDRRYFLSELRTIL